MKFNQYQTLVEAEMNLRKKGFKHSFKLDGDMMRCIETNELYTPEQMRIVEFHRFEGLANPADMSILFGIICQDGAKGMIISTYGPKVNMKLIEFLDQVKILRKDTNEIQSQSR